MRRVRTAVALAFVGAALLVGVGAPAQAAVPAEGRAVASNPSPYPFGSYYTLEACRYFGDSLVAGGAWRYYNCWYEWRSGEPQGYYYLYMYN
ncbi:hypothetical protein [Plantactinospora endophytica]|uniref:Secreted protein n=1 Tax=Plantactinospora endophytica TaxID=673535 RepID=A0ABQ4E8I3_9ACTN|nr:hypothetical protein [Plantactinospora endophytica]GIG90996.1 hypothetical protein Pen02_59320 [Plantactinospora endophytica]